MLTIKVQFDPSVKKPLLSKVAEKYDCQVTGAKRGGIFEISTEDPENLFWLGANINNELQTDYASSKIDS